MDRSGRALVRRALERLRQSGADPGSASGRLELHSSCYFTKVCCCDTFASTRRVLIGVVLGIAVAVPVGFLLGWFTIARTMADPLVNFFRALPPIALIPLVIVYFGVDETAKIVILFYAAFFSGVIVMYEGVSQINPLFVRVARTLGATRSRNLSQGDHPADRAAYSDSVARGARRRLGDARRLRTRAAQRGLGAMIQNASTYFLLDIIYVGIICIGLIALAMDLVLRRLSARLLRLAGQGRRMNAGDAAAPRVALRPRLAGIPTAARPAARRRRRQLTIFAMVISSPSSGRPAAARRR